MCIRDRDRLSSALTVADFFWKADSMTVVTRQQGMELDLSLIHIFLKDSLHAVAHSCFLTGSAVLPGIQLHREYSFTRNTASG